MKNIIVLKQLTLNEQDNSTQLLKSLKFQLKKIKINAYFIFGPKICITSLILISSNINVSSAQSNVIPTSGNVGIGTTSPIVSLQVNGTTIIGNHAGNNYNENLRLPTAADGYACISLGASPGSSGTGFGQWSLIKFPEADFSKFSIRHFSDDFFNILTNGNVGIGVGLPTEKLSVKGKIRAQEIKVENSNWPDFVFKSGYKLLSLAATEKHIKENGYLPGIPSAKEVRSSGVSIGDMNARLLQKIEEITLHLIEQNKNLEAQNKRLTGQQREIKSLKNKILTLNKR